MFYDRARIFVKGGDGGNGAVAFRREKYVPEGGPSGGDGGRGGSVLLVGDEGLRTLVDFRYQRHYKGDRGEHGMGKGMHGRSSQNTVVRLPVGTVVKDAESGQVLADIIRHGQEFVVAAGGRGGRGNSRFVSSTNRTPTLAEKGEPGEEKWIELELKLLADVGLVGFPNVGKSTLISAVSAAKPKIANYHFTTLEPNLGVVMVSEGNSFVMADIPGLIEGAHEGQGLGHQFLRHTERTRVLVHVLDISGSESRNPIEDFEVIQRELNLYKPELARRPMILAANKMDVPGAEDNLILLQDKLGKEMEIYPISAATGQGLNELVKRLGAMLEEMGPPDYSTLSEEGEQPDHLPGYKLTVASGNQEKRFEIDVEEGVFVVKGREVERHFAMTDFENEASLARFQQILERMGVDDALRVRGCKHGDPVRIKDMEFDFKEYGGQVQDR